MKKTDEAVVEIKNGKELLHKAVCELDSFRKGDAGGNVAKYPTVIIFLGEKCGQYVSDVKQPLDDNWNNALHLEYINVYKKGKSWFTRRLSTDTGEWEDSDDSFETILNSSIVALLGKDEAIFDDCGSVKLDYILDATENDSDKLYELFLNTEVSKLHITKFKTLYLMINQEPRNNSVDKSDAILQRIIADFKKDDSNNVYLISNQQKNGKFLLSNKLWMNYRLVADIIILGGNRNSSSKSNYALTKGLKTVAYSIVSKPTDQIGEVAIDNLLNGLFAEYERNGRKVSSVAEIEEQLEIGIDGSSAEAERLVRELFERKQLPSKSSVLYFPYSSSEDFKEMLNGNSFSIKALDARTFGVAQQYINTYYVAPINEYFEKGEEIEKYLTDWLLAKFTCFDFLLISENFEQISMFLKREAMIPPSPKATSLENSFDFYAKYVARKLFTERYKLKILEVLSKLCDMCENFFDSYREIKEEMRKERMINGEEERSIEKMYGDIVAEYLNNRLHDADSSSFEGLFHVTNTKKQMLSIVFNEYKRMIHSYKIFSVDFETELTERANRTEMAERERVISMTLESQMEGSIRLKNVIEFQRQKLATYYLINEKASYKDTLQNSNQYKQGDYLFFNLNRTDCVEQMELYLITDSDIIHLV